MNARNYSVVAIILLLVAAIVGFLAYKVNTMSDGIKLAYEEKTTTDLAAALNANDYEIYWIGQVPEYLDLIMDHVTLLTVGQANYETLPVVEGNTTMTIYNESGEMISHRENREYADNLLIIINTAEEIPDETWDLIRNCTVENRVPVLLIGDNNINAFREYMILVKKDYSSSSSMLFEFSHEAIDNPLDPSVVASGGRDYANAIMEFVLSRIENPVVVYVSSDDAVESQNIEETTITEETLVTEETDAA